MRNDDLAAIHMPPRIASLPRDSDGRPVPWSVATLPDGSRPHRLLDPGKVARAFEDRLCVTCGGQLGVYTAYLLDPHSATTGHWMMPGSHIACAAYTAEACPHLSTPGRRNPAAPSRTPAQKAAGHAVLAHEPGVRLVWSTRRDHIEVLNGSGPTVLLGAADQAWWYVAGKPVKKADVLTALAALEPVLAEAIAASDDPEGLALEFKAQHRAVVTLLRRVSL